jgi:gliding motility-associated-like protein
MSCYKIILLLSVISLCYKHACSQVLLTNHAITNNTNCNGKGCTYSGSAVLINEIMPTPSDNTIDGSIYDDTTRLGVYNSMRGEWVELFNPDNCRWADLSYCFLGNSFFDGNYYAGACFEFPVGTAIPPLGFAIVRGTKASPVSSNLLLSKGGRTVEIVINEKSFLNLQDFRFWMPNAGGWLALYDKYGSPMDAVTWNNLTYTSLDGHPSTPNIAGNFFNGLLPSYNGVPDNKKCKFLYSTPVSGKSYRRVPDGGAWMINSPANSTEGYCNDICASLPKKKCNGSAEINVINGIPPFNYQWDDSAHSTTSKINNLCPGKYHVVIKDSKGTILKDSVTINQVLPVLNLGNDTNYCTPISRILNAYNPGSSYTWSTGALSQAIYVSKPGTYSISLTTQNNCTVSDSILISQSVKPNLGKDTSICQNQNLVLDAGKDYKTFTWSDGTTGQTLTPKTSGTFYVKVTDKYNCIIGDTIQITIHPLPLLFLGKDTSYCKSYYKLNAGSGFPSYIWSNGSNDQSIIPEISGLYWVMVRDKNNCYAKDSISLTIFPLPKFDLGPDKFMCEGDSTTIDVGADFQYYSWSNGNKERTTNIKIPDKYLVTVTNNYNCIQNDSIKISFFPRSEITSIDTSINGQLIILDSPENLPHEYSIDKINFQSSNIFSHLASGKYTIYLKDKNKCITTDYIQMYEDKIIISNYFTPNSDGFHDTWEIEGISSYPNATIQIIDRFGKVVAIYSGKNPGWDGKCNSIPLKSDDYWYSIDLHNGTKPYIGHVTIKR